MGEQLSLTVDTLQPAVHWAEHHPDQVRFVLQLWEMDRVRGIPPSMDYYWHCVRRAGFTDRKTGSPVVCNDAMTSLIARYLKREHGIPFKTRDSWAERGGRPGKGAAA